ncbi:hypothetical protein CKO44_02935 [Rubrivivax gelatinosus]|uniref:lipopolysaccharide biosynthesis protein n=1 Tax=Rubrivivax gelatinosus TaxID=28068 RepID=UPI001A9112CD|nr:hypothetical protein [Rubrivivax gelatinosus]MBK1612420.1 hypothetical protein [Rubrivivax gelatinosus]
MAASSSRLSLDDMYANRFAAGALDGAGELRVFILRAAIGVVVGGLLWGWTDLVRGQGLLTLSGVLAVALLESLSLRETLLQAQSRFRLLSVLGTGRTIVGFSARLTVFLTGNASVAAMLCIAVAELVVMRGGTLALGMRRPKPDGKPVQVLSRREFANYASVTLLSLCYSRLDFLIGSQMLEPEEFGHYLAAQRFVEIYGFFATVIGALMMPDVAKLNGTAAFSYALHKSARMGILAIAICLVNVVIVRPLLPIVAGPRFAGIDHYYLILTFGLLPLFCGLPLGRIALAQRLPSLMMWGGTVAISLSAVLFFWLKDLASPGLVLASAMVTGNSIGCLVVMFLIWRRASPKPPTSLSS